MQAQTLKIEFKNSHTCPPEESNIEPQIIENIEISSKVIENDKHLEDYIYANPLFGVLKVQRYAISHNIKISKAKLKSMIFQIRKEVFPPMIEEAISENFCLTKGIEQTPLFQT